jgi:hypothetical protein
LLAHDQEITENVVQAAASTVLLCLSKGWNDVETQLHTAPQSLRRMSAQHFSLLVSHSIEAAANGLQVKKCVGQSYVGHLLRNVRAQNTVPVNGRQKQLANVYS